MTSTGSGDQPSATCPHCGAGNPPAFRFCGACGKPLERACSVCGRENPGGFRFCGYCGSPLGAPEREPEAPAPEPPPALEERKIVTVVFADLAASTELAARLDPEDLRGVLRPYFEAMAEEVARHGGTVEKFIGDAVVAVFGAPAAHEDDPVRAIRCALAMRARLEELNAELADRGIRLSLRIGVNTGEVVADPGADREGIVTGEAVNVASRFQVLAPPGGVVVGERTQRDARDAFRFRPLGEVSVKGLGRPLPAWEVVAALEEAPRSLQAPLVGRGDDLRLLRLLMERTVRDGEPNLVTVTGPAGIGKSRLARELVDHLRADLQEVRMVSGRCLPYGEGLTYWPLAEILKAHAGILDSDPQPVMLEKAGEVLQADLQEGWRDTANVLLASIGFPVPANPLEGADPETARALILGSWRRYFEAMAGTAPLLAVVEDVHWADRALLDLLEGLASRLQAPVLLLCLARPELAERRPGWGGGLTNATTIALSPLDADEGRELVGHLLGDGAPEAVVEMVLERSEGNPFFAEELLRMLIEDRRLARDEGSWRLERAVPASLPDTVQGVLAARIDLLSAEEKRAAQDAAVVGRNFWRGAVTALGASGRALEALVRKGLVREQPTSTLEGEQELAFTHILIRDVAYQSIPRGRRRELHAAFGAWVEGVTEGREEEFAEILAHHFEVAGDVARTARYAMLAGARKLRVFAAEEALPWLHRALEAAGTEAEAAGVRGESLLHRGSAHEQLARFPEAQADYEAAVAAARELDDGPLEARALAALAHISWLQDRYEEGRRITREALEKARSSGAPHLLGRILYTAGTNAFGQASWEEAEGFHREALEVAEREGDEVGTALAHHGLCETLCFMGRLETSLEHGRRSAELFRGLGQRLMLHHNDHMIGWALMTLGRLDEAVEAFEAGAPGSQEVGDRRSESVSVTGLATVSFLRGDLGAALTRLDAAARIAEGLEAPRVRLIMQGTLLPALVELRAWDRLEAELETALALSDALATAFYRPRLWAARGCVALARGDGDPEPLFARAREESQGSGFEALWAGLLELLAREMGEEPDPLERTATRLIALADPEAVGFRVWGLWGRALATSLRGDHEEAGRLAANALEASRELRLGPVAWRALRLRSRALGELDREEEAPAAEGEAAEMLRGILAGIEEEEARRSFAARPDVASLLGQEGP